MAIALAMLGLLAAAPGAIARRWSLEPIAAFQSDTILFGVSCPQANRCITVGDYGPYQQQGDISELWDGTRWRALNILSSAPSQLNSVSCPGRDACEAVGSGTDSAAGLLNGSTWAGQQTPEAGPLISVSCSSATACLAVRNDLVERWNGHGWQTEPASPPKTGATLEAVSCASARFCVAVGVVGHGVAERWDGHRWSLMNSPRLRGADAILLRAISCSSPVACTAVGYYLAHSPRRRFGPERQFGLAERWNGRRWVIQRLASPGRGRYVELAGVSCPAARACTAVGSYSTGHRRRWTLVERWNGHLWAVQATPNVAGAFKSLLLGVSCPSIRSCIAVGYSASGRWSSQTQSPLAERWS